MNATEQEQQKLSRLEERIAVIEEVLERMANLLVPTDALGRGRFEWTRTRNRWDAVNEPKRKL